MLSFARLRVRIQLTCMGAYHRLRAPASSTHRAWPRYLEPIHPQEGACLDKEMSVNYNNSSSSSTIRFKESEAHAPSFPLIERRNRCPTKDITCPYIARTRIRSLHNHLGKQIKPSILEMNRTLTFYRKKIFLLRK